MNGTLQQNRILIVDDDKRVRRLLRKYLEKEQFIVEEASLGWEALGQLHHGSYALIILDWILPDIKGIEICQYLRTNLSIPVMFLTAKSEEGNRLEAFKAGADDFVMKPFSPREVVLRIKTIMARYNGLVDPPPKDHSASEVLIASILINPTSRRVTIEDLEIHMTPKEFDLLYHLATHTEIAFSRQELLRIVWKVGHDEDLDYRTVDTHVKRLRDKLSEHMPNREDLIQTLWGFGYILRLPH
ncbi:response regulator transcription factor [Paenibacillus sp. FSL K6-0108]|uniref:response regulator transcription factor n=1 Tax=Paenibacillus sp. FSL K6-0108 TaxID=2921417 RepID=UPI0032542637